MPHLSHWLRTSCTNLGFVPTKIRATSQHSLDFQILPTVAHSNLISNKKETKENDFAANSKRSTGCHFVEIDRFIRFLCSNGRPDAGASACLCPSRVDQFSSKISSRPCISKHKDWVWWSKIQKHSSEILTHCDQMYSTRPKKDARWSTLCPFSFLR